MDIQKILDEQKRIAREQGIVQDTAYVNRAIANRLRLSTDDERKKISAAYNTPEGRAKQAAKSKPQSEDAKEKIRLANLGTKRSESRCKNISLSMKGNQHHIKHFMTPSGAFYSKKKAVDWATENGVINANGKFDNWIKTKPTEFYYISAEEYEKVKDIPPVKGLAWMQALRKKK